LAARFPGGSPPPPPSGAGTSSTTFCGRSSSSAVPERARRIPGDVYHVWNGRRDKASVGDRVAEGQSCEERTISPYDVPFECLSGGGDQARRALVELFVAVRDLRMAQKAAPGMGDAGPERSAAWQEYRKKWFTPVHDCRGEECGARQPVEKTAGGPPRCR
jgi:hypothetical protein